MLVFIKFVERLLCSNKTKHVKVVALDLNNYLWPLMFALLKVQMHKSCYLIVKKTLFKTASQISFFQI